MLQLNNLQEQDIEDIVTTFRAIGWDKPKSLFEFYIKEQREVMVLPGNEGAYQFWRKTIYSYTTDIVAGTKNIKHFKDEPRIIFSFKNKIENIKNDKT